MTKNVNNTNVFTLVGAGIMTTTLGFLIKKLVPNSRITIYEKLDEPASESSDSWNNAGTGHSAFCELNYTPEQPDGSVKIDKALEIASDFEISKQFWAYLKSKNILNHGEPFISKVPHMSFVWGDTNISFLKKRYEAMIEYALFDQMKYSEDFDEIASWVPLMMDNRDRSEKMAATWMEIGTDVNFDIITKGMINYLNSCQGVEVHFNHRVDDLIKQPDGSWRVIVKNLKTGQKISTLSSFVFLGAGGGAFPLLQKSGIKESKGYGGFPVSGKFYTCKNDAIINQHFAKVYGKAAEGSPPMSMPHLDQRVINGKKSLLFGPYAGISSKFLKNGSSWDLPKSLRLHNIYPMFAAGWHNLNLIGYLIGQATQSKKSRFATLKKYYPEAKPEDWDLYVAGQRVQIMKRDANEGGVLKLGTEIIASEDKSIAALLGASPGASTSVSAMIDVLKKCYPEKMTSLEWAKTLKEMIPSYGESLVTNQMLCKEVRNTTGKVLNIL
jgi:malate dehydrogenase (quinone)